MSILKKLLGQTAVYGISTVLSRLMNLLFMPLYTNLFPTEVYGVYINLYAYVAFINVVLTFGMETAFFRFSQESSRPEQDYGGAFQWVALMTAAFSVLACLLRAPIAAAMGYPGQERLILLLAGILALDALAALPLARLRQQERVKRFAFITLANVLVTIAANLVFVLGMGLGIEYVFVANLIASAVRLGMALWGNLPPRLRPERARLREMISYGFYIMLAGFAGIMNETLDRVMLPRRWTDGDWFDGMAQTGESLTGIYGANYKVAMLIALATQAFRYAAEPFFFKEAGEKDSPETFARIFHYYMIAALGGFLLIGSFMWEIVSFNAFGLTGSKTFVNQAYWSGLKAIPLLLGGYVLSGAYINMSIWFKITKQTRFALLFTGTGALITILVNYFGIPRIGYMAGAWATLLCYLVMSILVYLAGQRYYPIPYRMGRLLLYALGITLAWQLNAQIADSAGWAGTLMKAGLCALALGGVVLAERMAPVFGKASA